MKGISQKVWLRLGEPVEDAPIGDRERLLSALAAQGYENVAVPLPVLRRLYPMCREKGGVTVTLVFRGTEWAAVSIEPGDRRSSHYGLAVDLGSTTVVMELVDLGSGALIGQARAVNGQVAYGTDILTRITYAMESPGNRGNLRRAVTETLDLLMEQLTQECGISAAESPIMVLSGNTAMIHFLLELDAWTVFAAPYAPVSTDPGFFWGRELGIGLEGLVYIVPAASNYVGGDIVSGLLELGIHRNDRTSLFFDIGTNGELVIGNREWLMAGAGAAGPALEGYISRSGMRAGEGAVDSVKICGPELTCTTIGGKKPLGICGSGIIDLLAQMRLNGWMDISGALNPRASRRIQWLEDRQEYGAVYALPEESAAGEPLVFAQTDIMQYLDTKAAAATMVECLLETAGVEPESLDKLYLSGAFAAHSDLESAITIGMFPDLPRERFQVFGNTSLAGARGLLLDRSRIPEARELCEKMYCVQFASIPDFLTRMQAAKFVPHTDMIRYPTVLNRLREAEAPLKS